MVLRPFPRLARPLLAGTLLLAGCGDPPAPAPAPSAGSCGYRTIRGRVTVVSVEGAEARFRFDAEGRPGAEISTALYDDLHTAVMACAECLSANGIRPGVTRASDAFEVATRAGAACPPVAGSIFPLLDCDCPPPPPPPPPAAATTPEARAAVATQLITIAHQSWMPDDADYPPIGPPGAVQEGAVEEAGVAVPLEGGACYVVAGQALDAEGTPVIAAASVTLNGARVEGDGRLQLGFSVGYARPLCLAEAGEARLHLDGEATRYWLLVRALPGRMEQGW